MGWMRRAGFSFFSEMNHVGNHHVLASITSLTGRHLDRLNNFVIPGATAQITSKSLLDFVLVRIVVSLLTILLPT